MGVPTMSVAGPRDDDYAPVGSGGRRRVAVVAAVVIALALASVGGAGWYAGRQDAQIAGEPPLIRAEPGLTKQRPAEAGGLEVPHQDKCWCSSNWRRRRRVNPASSACCRRRRRR